MLILILYHYNLPEGMKQANLLLLHMQQILAAPVLSLTENLPDDVTQCSHPTGKQPSTLRGEETRITYIANRGIRCGLQIRQKLS